MSILRLKDAGFRYPGSNTWVFRRTALELKQGEVVRIVGRNGSGKSTLLKVVAGILNLVEGERSMALSGPIAYMDQFAGDMLARDLTIKEQFDAVAASNESSAFELLSKFDLDLNERICDFIGHLSGGEKQIVSLLSTLVSGAQVLCLDEFTSALDPKSNQTVKEILKEILSTKEVALLFINHAGDFDFPNRTFSLNEA